MAGCAKGAAIASACAAEQGKFWPMHDRLFAQPVRLGEADLRAAPGDAGVGLERFETCRAAPAIVQGVDADAAEAHRFRITGTPTVILGRLESGGRVRAREVVSGAKPIEIFRTSLDDLLKDRKS